MNEALEDYMREFCVISYRLVDGSHIIAIEDHYDPDQKAFYVSGAVQVNTNSEGRIFFSPWLINDNDELVRLLDSNIIASSPPIEDVAIQYHRYLLMSNLNGVLSPAEIKVVLAQLFNNDIDNQGNAKGRGGIFNNYPSLTPRDLEWRKQWKRCDNN